MTSKERNRLLLVTVGVAIVFLAIAQHFGWIAGPPPVLAPGIRWSRSVHRYLPLPEAVIVLALAAVILGPRTLRRFWHRR